MGIKPPSSYEMEAYVNQQRKKWKTYGCKILSNGWTWPTKLKYN